MVGMVRFSMEEADRLGLKLGMHICDGFALAGGPWITPKESMQKVVWSDTIVDGGKLNALRLPQPEAYENYYEDIALFALPVEDAADENASKDHLRKLSNSEQCKICSNSEYGCGRRYPFFVSMLYSI